jgi:hypothetical protein
MSDYFVHHAGIIPRSQYDAHDLGASVTTFDVIEFPKGEFRVSKDGSTHWRGDSLEAAIAEAERLADIIDAEAAAEAARGTTK